MSTSSTPSVQPFPPLDAIRLQPTAPHTATVIFLHGLGDSGHGWQPLAKMLSRDPTLHHIKWILPHAPVRGVTANRGMHMPAWFDIIEFGSDKEDQPGIRAATGAVAALLAEEDARTPGRVVLGGFSQGAGLSILAGLTSTPAPAGLLILSGRTLLRDDLKEHLSSSAKDLPVFWAHGSADEMIKVETARDGFNFVKGELGLKESSDVGAPGVDFKVYEGMPHSTCPEEVEAVREFLRTVVPGKD
ncbi:Phospholipase/carboxylesterase [Peniophora sp. CONT]|nr:Phospholipase/carboxylesterase [Peniophora sp. CONT]